MPVPRLAALRAVHNMAQKASFNSLRLYQWKIEAPNAIQSIPIVCRPDPPRLSDAVSESLEQ